MENNSKTNYDPTWFLMPLMIKNVSIYYEFGYKSYFDLRTKNKQIWSQT